ncbi:predicted protein [Botrytis cinerea T4]|uniref:Uncharacterized protein n=1 Tax=Botryotinia fuckeliana (strain T4) TaxID=999810 RepID=G2Y3J9_BOTF4|nr:predicted protein [Botrytis cinerea T4]
MPASPAVTPTGRRSIGVNGTKLRDIAKKRVDPNSLSIDAHAYVLTPSKT